MPRLLITIASGNFRLKTRWLLVIFETIRLLPAGPGESFPLVFLPSFCAGRVGVRDPENLFRDTRLIPFFDFESLGISLLIRAAPGALNDGRCSYDP